MTLAEVYLEYAGWIFLVIFALVSVLLAAAAAPRLPERWWIAGTVSAVVVMIVAGLFALALSALDTGDSSRISGQGWVAIGIAGALGFVAATDVQLAIAAPRSRPPGFGAVIAGAILGPVIVVGGYLLLVRSMDWARFGI